MHAYCVAEDFKFTELCDYISERWPAVQILENPSPVIIRPHTQQGTMFFFKGGTVVCWGSSKFEIDRILKVNIHLSFIISSNIL